MFFADSENKSHGKIRKKHRKKEKKQHTSASEESETERSIHQTKQQSTNRDERASLGLRDRSPIKALERKSRHRNRSPKQTKKIYPSTEGEGKQSRSSSEKVRKRRHNSSEDDERRALPSRSSGPRHRSSERDSTSRYSPKKSGRKVSKSSNVHVGRRQYSPTHESGRVTLEQKLSGRRHILSGKESHRRCRSSERGSSKRELSPQQISSSQKHRSLERCRGESRESERRAGLRGRDFCYYRTQIPKCKT